MGKAIVALTRKVGTFSNANMVVFQTHIQAVEGLLDGSGVINMSLLPRSLKSGLKPVGDITWSTTVPALNTFDAIWSNSFNSGDDVLNGDFVIVDSSDTNSWVVSTGHIITNGDDGGGSITGDGTTAIQLEKNDWVVFMGTSGVNKLWQIVNHTYPVATTIAAGLMSAADKLKLNGLSNYTHPSFTPTDQDLTNIQTIDTITFDNGHISAITKQAIRSASESDTGILRLATQNEARAALGTSHTDKAISRERAIDVMKYFPVLKLYEAHATEADNLTDANASLEHGEGALVLIKVGEVTV